MSWVLHFCSSSSFIDNEILSSFKIQIILLIEKIKPACLRQRIESNSTRSKLSRYRKGGICIVSVDHAEKLNPGMSEATLGEQAMHLALIKGMLSHEKENHS